MSQKKELNSQQLEKVSGGTVGADIYKHLSGQLTTSQTYNHQNENLFFYSDCGYTLFYAKLKKSCEDYGIFNLYSFTKYDIEIIESNLSGDNWGPGNCHTLHSNEYKVFTNYSGDRPLKY